MASSAGLRVLLLLVAGCTHAPVARPAQPSLDESRPAEARPAEAQPVEAQPLPVAVAAPVTPEAPKPPCVAMGPLSASPGHHVLEWLVDVIAHRKGEVSHDELVEHFDKKLLGPVSTTAADFHKWAAEADGAVLESIEIDDPTYIRAYLATHDFRWKVVIEFEPSTSKLTYLSWHRTR